MGQDFLLVERPRIIGVSWSKPFNRERFFCGQYAPVHDKESQKVFGFNVTHLKLVPPEKAGDKRLTHLDAKAFEALWDNRDTLPPEWRELIPPQCDFFQCYLYGTKFINECGGEHVLYLRWAKNYEDPSRAYAWHWGLTPIAYDWGCRFPVLAF